MRNLILIGLTLCVISTAIVYADTPTPPDNPTIQEDITPPSAEGALPMEQIPMITHAEKMNAT